MIIYLIRHGKTLANEQHLYCGSTDLPLSEAGRMELTALSYAPPEGCRYLTSGMTRCEQTLSLLFGPVAHEAAPAFRELDFGAFEMHSYAELKDAPAYQTWIAGNNEDNPTPGGESGTQMTARAIAAFQALAAEDRNTVLVTHGGVIAAIMNHLFPQADRNRYQWQPAPGHGYRLTRTGSAWAYSPLPVSYLNSKFGKAD